MCGRGLEKLAQLTEKEILILSDEMRERLMEQKRERKKRDKDRSERGRMIVNVNRPNLYTILDYIFFLL